MIANITNIDGHVSGEALLPFFNSTVEIELDSDSQEDIGFAERQLAFLSALPVETYVRLCRHSVDYAADLVDYVGEYLGMFDEEEFQDEIIPSIMNSDYSELSSMMERWFKDEDTFCASA